MCPYRRLAGGVTGDPTRTAGRNRSPVRWASRSMVKTNHSVERTLALAIAVACTLFLYYPTIHLGLLSDDFERLEDTVAMSQSGPAAFLLQAGSDGYYRPLFYASLALDAALGGLRPAWFHGTNLVLHLAVLGLALGMISRHLVSGLGLPRRQRIPLMALIAVALSLYPHHVDSVSWISDRSDLLSTLFCLGSLAFLLASRTSRAGRWAPFLVPALLGLGILSKESAFAFPLVLAAAWALSRRPRLTGALVAGLGVTLVLAAWRVIRFGAMGSGRITGPGQWISGSIQSGLWALLPVDGEWAQEALGGGLRRASVLLLLSAGVVGLGLIVLLLWRRGTRPAVSRGLTFAALTLALPALLWTRARYLYLPSFGLVPAVVIALLVPFLALMGGKRPDTAGGGLPSIRTGGDGRWARPRLLATALLGIGLGAGLCGGYASAALRRRAAWVEAAAISERFHRDLVDASRAAPGRSIYVLGAPFTVRGASIAANWSKALRLTEGLDTSVHVLNWVRVPSSGWEGPTLEWTAPGEFVLRLRTGPHTALHYPGDAFRDVGPVRLHRAEALVSGRDESGRATSLVISLDTDLWAERPLVLLHRAGGRLERVERTAGATGRAP